MSDTPTQSGGETQVTDVDSAAKALLGRLDANEPPKGQRKPPEETETPTQEDGETEETTEEVTSEETAEDDAEGANLETVEELAEATGLTIEAILNLKAKAKVDGKDSSVPLSEILKSYQLSAHVNNQSQELANQRKAFEAERERVVQELNIRMQEAHRMGQHLEQQLMAEYNAIDWNGLRAANPAEWAAAKQDYNERYAQIQQMKQGVAQELQRQQLEVQHKTKEARGKLLAEEQAKLVQVIPEFGDEAKAKQLTQDIRSFLKEQGYQDNDINNIYDHRQVALIRDAMRYRQLQSKKPEVTKKVINLPKVQKPGAAKSKADIKGERLNQKRAAVRKSGHVSDVAALLMEKIL